MSVRLILLAAALLVLSSCAGTGEKPDSASADRKAAEVNTSLGREYMSRGQKEVALEKLKKAIAADPKYAPGHTMIAVLYEQIGELDLAEEHYEKAVKASPANGDVNNNYGVFLCNIGKYREAEPYFLQAVKDPFYSTPEVAFANAGSCMQQDGQLEKAERYLRQSLEYDRKFPDALLSMAGLEFRNADYLGARAFIQRYEATGSESAEGLGLGMRIEEQLNDPRLAREYQNRLLTRFPDSAEARRLKSEASDD
jgi:type IV pilus assembly protein PilF